MHTQNRFRRILTSIFTLLFLMGSLSLEVFSQDEPAKTDSTEEKEKNGDLMVGE